jgi:two-component system phosphate regulon sensor histidine kinase PhoR
MNSLPVPFHFTATFMVTIAAFGGLWVSIRRPEFGPSKRGPRLAFTAAWALLATGELLHGSLIIAGELDKAGVALRAGAYAFFVLALIGARDETRDSQKAAAVAPGASNLMPMFLGFSAALLAFRSRLPGARRLALALGLLGASELVFGLAGDLSKPSAAWFIAHGVRLIAGVAIGAWLWEALVTSIQVRFVAVFVALLLVVVIAISSSVAQVFVRNIRDDAISRAAYQGELQNRTLDERTQRAVTQAGSLAGLDAIRDLVSRRDPSLQQVATRFQSPGGLYDTADFLAFFDSSGAILALSAQGNEGPNLDAADAVSLAGAGVVQSALNQQQAGSIDLIGASKVGVVGAFPVFNPPGKDAPGAPQGLAGVVAMGQIVNRQYLSALNIGGQGKVSAVTRKQVIATTLADAGDLLGAIQGTVAADVFDAGRISEKEASISGTDYFNSIVPMERADNTVVAALVISQPSEVLQLTQQNVGRTLFLLALLAAVVAIGLSYLSGSRITRPIRSLTKAAERVRLGDLDVKAQIDSPDEVGALGRAFDEMTVSLQRLTTDLRSTAEQLQTILQSMADGVIAVDAQGRVVAFNKEAERLAGLSAGEAEGKPVREVLIVRNQAGASIGVPIYGLATGAVVGVIVAAGAGERTTPAGITCAPILDEAGAVAGGVAVLRDLTREMEIEQMKTQFLSNISHELRTPLTPIKGYADILRRRKLPRKKTEEFLDGILASADRLQRIVEMLVDFSAIEGGRLVPRTVTFDLGRAAAGLVDQWTGTSRKHRFEKRGLTRLPMINGDERLLPRAVGELIDNAVKFSPRGGKIVVTGETGAEKNGAGEIRISVADHGIGIAPDQLPNIFGDFTQVDPSETRQFGGLGIGLAYVRRIVESHGGKVEVRSKPGAGSKFTIILPSSVTVKKVRKIPVKGRAPSRQKASPSIKRSRGTR